MSKVIVVFVKSYDRYNTGEVAGFAEGRARELVQSGIAKYKDERPKVEKPKLAKKDVSTAPKKSVPKRGGRMGLDRSMGTSKSRDYETKSDDGADDNKDSDTEE